MSSQGDELGRRGPSATIPKADIREEDCFKIMLATDNHIGYNEKDPIRGQDAINTFREILEIARREQVDFILLAGDLFHENRPSRTCLHQTMALLREYTLGDRPVSMELLSDPMEGKTAGFSFPAVNYEDPNLNVAIPVFSIHGNHDDPQGTGPEGALCALDVLSVAGVLNYFGKVQLSADQEAGNKETDGMQIRPIMLQKGTTRLALYGIGNMKDVRMHYELRTNRVRMFMPEEDEEPPWFNILLVHQNRVNHGPQSAVPEAMFDDSIDLVVWGHEHDCRINPEMVPQKPYFITQPGSSVATSLAHGEALQKKVGILSIQGDQFDIEPVVLRTVRPFQIDEVLLDEEAEDPANGINLRERDTITNFLKVKVEAMIQAVEDDWNQEEHAPGEKMMLPLIRLKVETTGAKEVMNAARFGQQFAGRVANPKDVLQYHRKKLSGAKKGDRVAADQPDFDDLEDDEMNGGSSAANSLSKLRMNELVSNYLKAQSLEVLVDTQLEDAVTRYVEKDDLDSIRDFVSSTMKIMESNYRKPGAVRNDIDHEAEMDEAIARGREIVAEQDVAERPAKKGAKKAAARPRAQSDDSMLEDSDNDVGGQMVLDSQSDASRSTTRGGARRTATGAAKKVPAAAAAKGKAKAVAKKTPAAASTKKAGKGKQPLFADDDDEESEDEEVEDDVPARRGGRARKAGGVYDEDEDEDDEDEVEEEHQRARARARSTAGARGQAQVQREAAERKKEALAANAERRKRAAAASSSSSAAAAAVGRRGGANQSQSQAQGRSQLRGQGQSQLNFGRLGVGAGLSLGWGGGGGGGGRGDPVPIDLSDDE